MYRDRTRRARVSQAECRQSGSARDFEENRKRPEQGSSWRRRPESNRRLRFCRRDFAVPSGNQPDAIVLHGPSFLTASVLRRVYRCLAVSVRLVGSASAAARAPPDLRDAGFPTNLAGAEPGAFHWTQPSGYRAILAATSMNPGPGPGVVPFRSTIPHVAPPSRVASSPASWVTSAQPSWVLLNATAEMSCVAPES
jgi:hypothetical protein